MSESSRPLTENLILRHIITPGSIITLITSPIHTPSVVIIVFTSLITVIGGSKWVCFLRRV